MNYNYFFSWETYLLKSDSRYLLRATTVWQFLLSLLWQSLRHGLSFSFVFHQGNLLNFHSVFYIFFSKCGNVNLRWARPSAAPANSFTRKFSISTFRRRCAMIMHVADSVRSRIVKTGTDDIRFGFGKDHCRIYCLSAPRPRGSPYQNIR